MIEDKEFMKNRVMYKLVGDKIEMTSLDEMIKANEEPSRLFSTELNVFNLKATISTIFLPFAINLNTDAPLVFETMIFSEIKDLHQQFSKRATSLRNALHDHYDLTSLAFGYLQGHHQTNEKLKKIKKVK